MEHLVCFMGGLLALGAYTDPNGMDSDRAKRDLGTAKDLAYTCYQMYARTKTGLTGDVVNFSANHDFGIAKQDYNLRPETVETFYILYLVTGEHAYREWGWEIFESIEQHCRREVGYGTVNNVQDASARSDNHMESFFMGETLKYLYLMFDPDSDVDVLRKHVFNTEAHPLRNFDSLK
eukprot:CAMPEP_0172524404 /NCGR_PEP_ID=MMETSP1066-20121228/294170_1 /TAXON_ID=671091 /ORGANISM="Coscinodiscus wailesii, Strain CCMP2513" /LENGTH=177 /DNA_ID=CAMNT_0013307529 /DNA_START=134 /DNA_END=667 /DNA_ORIENTATION=+